jgi:hypothetical protein
MLILLAASLTLKAADPVAGKIFFSNQPMLTSSAGSKNVFSSSEYIYARLELNGSTIKEAFRMKDGQKGYPYIQYRVTITNSNGYEMGNSGRDYILLKDDTKNGSVLSFDVMPEPARATTVVSILEDFSAGYGFSPFPDRIFQEKLKEGKYTVKVKLYLETQDEWGSWEDQEKWPTITEEFEFNFRSADAARIISDRKEVTEVIIANAFRLDKMPPVFSNPGKLTDPGATTAKVSAILKRDLPGRAIIKFVAEQYNGAYWSIAKDDYGLPQYRYFNPHIWMAYKMDGKCYVGYVTLRQVYSGGGTYGPLQVAWTSTKDDRGIDCAKVK